MAISNIFTLTKSSKQAIINEDTQNFAFEILRTWHDKLTGITDNQDKDSIFDKEIVLDKDRDKNIKTLKQLLEKAENREVIKNLVYASLILFYNILLKDHKEKSVDSI